MTFLLICHFVEAFIPVTIKGAMKSVMLIKHLIKLVLCKYLELDSSQDSC